MYAIATIVVCTLWAGCISGVRDEGMADKWMLADTKEECEARNLAVLLEIIAEQGDQVLRAKIKCERVGT